MNDKLYQICPMCDGQGRLTMTDTHSAAQALLTGEMNASNCPGCKPLRVVEVGVTEGQLRRMAKRDAALPSVLAALVKLWKHTPKIDNGRCMICGVGYASFENDGHGGLSPGSCSDPRCLSHVVKRALAENS